MNDYRLLTVTFGTASAPYLAVKSLQQLAHDEESQGRYLTVTERVRNDYYMDDLMTGCDTEEEAIILYKDMTTLLEKGGFKLQKWTSNNNDLLNKIKDNVIMKGKENQKERDELKLKLDSTIKILGLTWCRDVDSFRYIVNLTSPKDHITKRNIISDISRLFDPLGWVAPSVVISKIIIQKLWLTGINWDDEVPENIVNEWVTYHQNLSRLNEIQIPRWFGTYRSNKIVELHGFCDASKLAYAAVVYIRTIDKDDQVYVNLGMAKTKVAPIKQVSIPRLELCGAVLVTRLLVEMSTILKISKQNLHAWTDSTVVLAWLNSHPSRWQTFVANRVAEIVTTLDPQQWSHVESKKNPADCASRGTQPAELLDTSIWFSGPDFLYQDVIQVWSAPGGMTRLPCDLVAPVRDVAMMLWFKDGDRMPIYTVDFRNGPPVHWAVAGQFGARTHFVLNESDPSSAHLSVEKVARQDEGMYRCRIDYIDSPTRNYRVNLTVIIPPESPRIYDSEGKEIFGNVAGPFREGQDLLLSCQAAGGKPPPDVSWYHGEELLAITKDGSVCQVHLPRISREMAHARLQCKVEPPLLQSMHRDVTLKLYLKPQFVRVTGKGTTRAGQDRSFVCTTRGSKPAPNIDWFINSQRVDSTLTQTEVDGDVTKSVLSWHVKREDSGRQLVCRVSNPWFPAYTLEDSVMFDVMYPPVAQISLIEPKEPRLLKEDEDAVLLCSADATPAATNFTFYRGPEVHQIQDDPIGGISVERNKLTIRGLMRHHSTLYRCRARNSEGSALSEPLTLNVLSRPECASGSVIQQLAGAPGGEVRARCSVTAPLSRDAGPLRFYWTYNGTRDVLAIPASNVTVVGASSTVIHGLPDNDDEDLGWLACWSSNDVGNQREPCLFRIMAAGLPEPPSNCEIENEVLHCEPGHDGGLTQRFLLEALEVRQRVDAQEDNEISTLNDQGISGRGLSEAVYRVRNDRPHFSLDALSPGRYTLLVYSETPRGRSPRPAALQSVSIRTADDLDVPGSLQTMTPAPPPPTVTDNSVALLTGAVLSLILLTILTTLCVALVVMCKKKSPRRDPEQSTILRRNVGVSMYGGSSMTSTVVPTVVVRGHRGSRILAARWSGVLDEAPLAVLALDTRPHDDAESRHSDAEQEIELTTHADNTEIQTD